MPQPGFVVGLTAEARLLRSTGWAVEIGGGTPEGALDAAWRLVTRGAPALVSFGLAGGLDPALRPGDILIPRQVLEGGEPYPCDAALMARLGGGSAASVLAAPEIAVTAADKAALFIRSGAAAVDLESGAVARVARAAGLPFAVARAVADPASRSLPPAAVIALGAAGRIRLGAVAMSLLRRPGQMPDLLALSRDAARARAALIAWLRKLPRE